MGTINAISAEAAGVPLCLRLQRHHDNHGDAAALHVRADKPRGFVRLVSRKTAPATRQDSALR
jgi:hypothetical protein